MNVTSQPTSQFSTIHPCTNLLQPLESYHCLHSLVVTLGTKSVQSSQSSATWTIKDGSLDSKSSQNKVIQYKIERRMDSTQNISEAHHSQFLNDFQATEEVESWQALISPLDALHNRNDNSVTATNASICNTSIQAGQESQENIGQSGYDHTNEDLYNSQNDQTAIENEIHTTVENSV